MRLFGITAFTIIATVFFSASSSALYLGPYSGQVLDNQTEQPIPGASLLIYWEKYVHFPPGLGGSSELITSILVQADNNGNYEIPAKFVFPAPDSIFEATTIIVYQPGYRAYIKTIEYKAADEDFKKKNNIIKLDKIPPNFNYKDHYDSIKDALGGIDEMYIIPPKIYDAFSGTETRMPWDLSIEKALQRKSGEAFLRRVEWENRR